MGGSTSTSQAPSLLDSIRAEFAGRLGPDVLGKIFGGLRDFPTADQMVDLYSQWRATSGGLGNAGVGPGDPRMLEQFGKATKDAFGVNHDALNAALQLFTGTPGVTGGSSSKTSPGAMGTLGSVANLGLGAASLGSAIGGGSAALAGSGSVGAGAGSAMGFGAGAGGTSALGSGAGASAAAAGGGSSLSSLLAFLPFFSWSSRALKQDIEPLESEDCLKKVCSLRSVGYIWKHNAEPDAGLIAEELMEVIPEAGGLVGGYNGIKPLTVIGYLVESIKQLNNELNALKAQNGGDR